MQVNARVEVTDAVLKLRNGEKRLAYGVALGILETMKTIQAAEFEHVAEVFTIRKPAFFFGTPGRPGGAAARMTVRPSVRLGRPYGELEVDTKRGKGGRVLLPLFEKGGPRPLGTPGAETSAVPVLGGPARPTEATTIPKGWTLAGLGLHLVKGREAVRRRTQGGKRFVKFVTGSGEGDRRISDVEGRFVGKNRTFLVRRSDAFPFGGIAQRVSKDRIRGVYWFAKGQQLDDRLGWIARAVSIADRWLNVNIDRQLSLSLAAGGLSR